MIEAGYVLLLGNAWEAQSQDGMQCELFHWLGEAEKNPQRSEYSVIRTISAKKSHVPLP
jgi:hypothetical protein